MKQKHSSRTVWDAIFKEKNTIACIEGGRLLLPKNANILKAWWGVPDLQRGILCDYSKIKNGMIADNKNLGIQFDPVPGRVKILVVTYSGEGAAEVEKAWCEQNSFACIEGYKLILPENINIIKVWYGVPGLDGVDCNLYNIKNGMIVNNETMGNDPVPGKRKTLVIIYNHFSPVLKVFEKVVIVATSILKSGVANNIKKQIKQIIKPMDVEIITEFPILNKDNHLYIFLYFYNIFDIDKYPKHYIVWQIEQLSSKDQKAYRLTQDKINVFNNAINIFEISMKNYNNIYDSNISRKKILYNPIPFYNEKNNILFDEKNIDCVFFGAANNRRMTINKYLKKELDKHGITFKILYGVYDKELTDILEKTKYVINLHYYDKPCLEGARINIAIENNCVTISEDVFDDEYTKELYKDYVIYNPCVKEDLSNIDIFINSIIHNLKPEIYKKNRNFQNRYKEKLSVKFENLLKKNLLSCVYIKNSKLDITSTFDIYDIKYFKKNLFCLHLIENNKNRTKTHLSNILPNDFTYYYANKYVIGYIGCGASFYNLIYNAKKFNLENITIFEDDCKFNSDFEKQYKIIKEFLNIYKDWDIFNGFVCDIMTKKNFAIKKIYSYKGITFLHINEMVGMVFNIYNKKSYDIILNNWNTEKFIKQHLLNGGNISNNYIDQILNKKANNIIITMPYLFNIHQVNSEVDLANGARNIDFEYNWYQKKLKETYRYLNNKINEYLINNKVINL